MTQAAQGALRRVIEQYTKNVRFCIICNYVNKIIPAIQSRCTRFRFNPLDPSTSRVASSARHRVRALQHHPRGKEALLKLSRGDMRRALNVLQACTPHPTTSTKRQCTTVRATHTPRTSRRSSSP